MPKGFILYVKGCTLANKWLGKIISRLVLVLIAILLFEAIARYIFNSPTSWSIELATFVFGAYFLLGSGYILLKDRHVSMDLFSSRWSERKKAIINVATIPLPLSYLVTFLVGGVGSVQYALRFHQTSPSIWGPPLAPIKIIMLVGAGILLLTVIVFLIRNLSIIFKGKDIT